MTRTQRTQPVSPAEAAALIRQRQWEVEAEKARDRSFWSKPRFDLIDLIAIVLTLTGSLTLLFTLH